MKKTLSIITAAIFIFLIGQFILYKFKIDHVLLGVVREMFTIPSVLGLPVLLVVVSYEWSKEKFKATSTYTILTIVLLFLIGFMINTLF
ncbi:MAG: hypothetical protein HRT68_09000 [Flavobacteriaceae bacterium]|nr:hypothetical protein [Flavobacteriaceae bacterium]